MSAIGQCYQAKKAASLANPITNAVPFVQSDDATKVAGCFVPPVYGTNSQAFRVRARGRSTTGTSGNFAISLQWGSSIAAATNTVVCAPTTQTNALNCPYFLEAIFLWDATQKSLNNIYMAMNSSTAVLVVYVAGTSVAAVDLSTGSSGNQVCAAALFGTSNAGNIAYLDELSLEVL